MESLLNLKSITTTFVIQDILTVTIQVFTQDTFLLSHNNVSFFNVKFLNYYLYLFEYTCLLVDCALLTLMHTYLYKDKYFIFNINNGTKNPVVMKPVQGDVRKKLVLKIKINNIINSS